MFADKRKTDKGDKRELTEDDFFQYYRSAKGADDRYRMVWNMLVFPNTLTTFDRGQDGLEDFFRES
jgi:hypothetical protein